MVRHLPEATDLYFFFPQRDPLDNVHTRGFVGLRIQLILSFQDRMIFGTIDSRRVSIVHTKLI